MTHKRRRKKKKASVILLENLYPYEGGGEGKDSGPEGRKTRVAGPAKKTQKKRGGKEKTYHMCEGKYVPSAFGVAP